MDYHLFKAAVNGCFSPFAGGRERPEFLDISATRPELNEVVAAYPAIREELERLLESQRRLPLYHDVDRGETKISAACDSAWSVCMLEILGHRLEANRRLFPETCAAVARVPNVIQAFFSILAPHKSVPKHEGPYLGYLRFHLGLVVPRNNPPKIIVNGRDYVWREGEGVLFDDSHPHEVVNYCDERRAVLIIDIERPMPWLPTMLNRATEFVARHTYGRSVARKAEQFAARAA